jgi:hypothetical protein
MVRGKELTNRQSRAYVLNDRPAGRGGDAARKDSVSPLTAGVH